MYRLFHFINILCIVRKYKRLDEFVFYLIDKTISASILFSLNETATVRFLYLGDMFPAFLIMQFVWEGLTLIRAYVLIKYF